MITKGKNGYIPYLKKIWKECFGDSDEYINLFFSNKYNNENVLIKIYDYKPVSMLFLINTDVIVNGKYENCAYIYGVSTLKNYRGYGFSTELINYANNNCGFFDTILVPASKSLFDFYKLKGYKKVFNLKKIKFKTYKSNITNIECINITNLEYKNLRDNMFLDEGYVCWNDDFIKYALYENIFCGGINYSIKYKNNTYAIMFYVYKNTLFVKEAIIDDYYLYDILNFIALKNDCDNVVCRVSKNSLYGDTFDFALCMGNIKNCSYFNIALD